jgi:hypothetical protein
VELQAEFRVALELGVPLTVVRSMSIEEFHGWLEYLSLQAREEKKAFEKAKKRR